MKPTAAAPIVAEEKAMSWADEYPETPASPEQEKKPAAGPAGGKLTLGFDLSRLGSTSSALPAGAIRPTGGSNNGQPRYNLVPLDMRTTGTLIQPTDAAAAPAGRKRPPTTYGHTAGDNSSDSADEVPPTQPAPSIHDPYTTPAPTDAPAPTPYAMATEEVVPSTTVPMTMHTAMPPTGVSMHGYATMAPPTTAMYEETAMPYEMTTPTTYDSTYDTSYYASMF